MPTIEEVFPIAGTPAYTYQKRESLENDIERYAKHGRGGLLVYGPTKAGKSVLVQRLMPEALYVRGDVQTEVELWSAISTNLGTFTGRSKNNSSSTAWTLGIGAKIKAWIAGVSAKAETTAKTENAVARSSSDDPQTVVLAELAKRKRVLIIDDFHFMPRTEQQKVMAALKGFIDGGGRVVFIIADHRAHHVGSLVGNLSGRITPVKVPAWQIDELKAIAHDGFEALKVNDGDSLAGTLAHNAFGSPQLMQRLCQALCKANGVLETQAATHELRAPIPSWEEFYRGMVSPVDPEMRWVEKLTEGPLRRGTERNTYPTHRYGQQDGYGLVILAMAALLPSLEQRRADIETQVGEIVSGPRGPRNTETASKLKYLSDLAGAPLDAAPRGEGEEAGETDHLEADPVLEYEESGATSVLRLVDPLFVFALRWGDNPAFRPVD